MFEIIGSSRNPSFGLRYRGEQILTESQAWEVTFKKWEMLRKTIEKGKLIEDGGKSTCGLCILYYYGHSDECEECPIAKAGYPGCGDTPYMDYRNAVKSGSLSTAMKAIEKENSFLRSLYLHTH